MILVAGILVGLTAGLCRAWIGKRKYWAFELKLPIFVLLAFIPQYFAFYAPKMRSLLSENFIAILLISSLIILLIFSILNIQKPGFWPIGLGFFLNFLVIVLNGGFMPISLETVHRLTAGSSSNWIVGQRFGFSKDIILTPEMTKLAFLSDHLIVTHLLGFNFAFSWGDILISIGIIWLLWMLGGKSQMKIKESTNE